MKSVETSTFVAPPSPSVTTLVICALAPPCPRLSVPLARMTAVCDASSTDSMCSDPR